MSGYNVLTGWTHFTGTKVDRYYRDIPEWFESIEARCEDAEVPYFWDATGGLHAGCSEGRLWELLSGRPATRGLGDPEDVDPTQLEFISVTDLGAVVSPPLPTSTVLKVLREEGLLARVGRTDVPTEAARGLFEEREAEPTSRFPSKEGSIQRRWSYEVLLRLRGRRDDLELMRPAPRAPSPPKRRSRLIALKFATVCGRCDIAMDVGTEAWWMSGTRAWCVDCDAKLDPAEQ